MYLVCIRIIAAVGHRTVKHLDPALRYFKGALTILTVGPSCAAHWISARALVFKVFALRPSMKLRNVLVTNLIHTVMYGFFSTVVYACVLCVVMVPLPDGVDHSSVGVEFLPKDKRG
jgi:hypothetical protein